MMHAAMTLFCAQGWADNIGRLLELVEKSTMNIQKEAMTHKVTLVSATFGG